MKTGKFRASVNRASKIFSKLELLADHITFPEYARRPLSGLKHQDYMSIWRYCVSERLYDFLLWDQSIVQFRNEPAVSFSYLECPFAALSLQEFAQQQSGEHWVIARHELREEYEQYLETVSELKDVVPVRYDYDPTAYESGCHPAAHVHFGVHTNIRVASERLMEPLGFVYFVLRHYYPRSWRSLLDQGPPENMKRIVRDSLETVPTAYRQEKDYCEVFLR